MAYFKKGVGLVKVAYKSNFEMRSLNVNFKAGSSSFTPQLYGVDGLSSVNIVDESLGKAMITAPLDVLSIDLPPEYENIGSKAFLACSNLESVYVYAGKVITLSDDAFPANCVVYVDNEFLTEYQTEHPLLDIRGFNSGYVYEIPYQDGLTPTTLTAQYVNDVFDGMTLDRKTKIGKVVVPVYFTAYESGSINAIIAKTPNLEHLVPCYEAGNIDLDMNGDIVAKIVSIGKTVDEALVYARTMNLSTSTKNNSDVIIVPPINTNIELSEVLSFCSNLVYVPYVKSTNDNGKINRFCWASTNLIEANVVYTAGVGKTPTLSSLFHNAHSLKRASANREGSGTNKSTADYFFIGIENMEHLILSGLNSSCDISSSTKFTRQALVDLFNSLGTPSTTQTLTIGATNLAKLTAEDLAIATAKNWQLA